MTDRGKPERRPAPAASSELLDRLPAELARSRVHACLVDRHGARTPTSGWPFSATACWRWPSPPTSTRGSRPSEFGAGRLTKIRAQAVSGRSCRAVAERLGVPERLRAAAPCGVHRRATGADRHRARAGVGDRGGDRCLLSGVRLRARPRPRSSRRSRPRSRTRSSIRSTSSRRCRSASPGAARWSATTSSRSRARRTTAPSRSAPRSTASRSAAAPAAARRTPSRRPRRRRWRRCR